MKFFDYSHRHGKELMELIHPEEHNEIQTILEALEPFPHGQIKNHTPVKPIADSFFEKGWELEKPIPLGTDKNDYCDIYKNRLYIEQEYSKFETLFRDFLRFLLLHDKGQLDVGVVICYDDLAFERWGKGVSSYHSSRATLQRTRDFLKGDYGSVIRVPLWIIGIE